MLDYVLQKSKKINAKVVNLMSGSNETRLPIQHELCEWNWKLPKSAFNSKQEWNQDEYQYKCKELYDWSSCEDDYMWNPSTSNCESKNACKIDEYLDIKDFSCNKRLFRKIIVSMWRWDIKYNWNLKCREKNNMRKNNSFIHTITLVIICFYY